MKLGSAFSAVTAATVAITLSAILAPMPAAASTLTTVEQRRPARVERRETIRAERQHRAQALRAERQRRVTTNRLRAELRRTIHRLRHQIARHRAK